MKLSEFFNPSTGRLMVNQKAKLVKDITVNDKVVPTGTVGNLFKDYGDGYHFEMDDFAFKVSYDEVNLLPKK